MYTTFLTSSITPPAGGSHQPDPVMLDRYQRVLHEQRLTWTEHHCFIKLLGAGGQGVVYLSERRGTDKFTIPVALGIIEPEDRGYLAKGVLAGIVTIPLGVLAGGLVAGFDPAMVFANLIPIVIAAALIALGLWRTPDKMTTGFEWFGKGLVALISVGLVISVFEFMTNTQIMPDGWELAPPTDGLAIVGLIGMMLLGAFPAVYLIVTFASKPLTRVGRLIGINDKAAGGLIASLANNIPMFQIFKEMDARGKVLNAAFAVSAA